jgi:hypothetical protein
MTVNVARVPVLLDVHEHPPPQPLGGGADAGATLGGKPPSAPLVALGTAGDAAAFDAPTSAPEPDAPPIFPIAPVGAATPGFQKLPLNKSKYRGLSVAP